LHFTICDYILDIYGNAIEADAAFVAVEVKQLEDKLTVCINDNGKGMDKPMIKKALDPYYSEEGKHDKRKVGLGLPFIAQATKIADGGFSIKSDLGIGTTVIFTFDMRHIDTPPLGDLVGSFTSMMTMSGVYELSINRSFGESSYSVSRQELIDTLGSIDDVAGIKLLKEYIISLEQGIA